MSGNLVGDFLRARRQELRPEDVGLPPTGRRRTAGLRREEVASLASISTDYYTRIEQGRRTAPPQTMDLIADVLRIDRSGREYLAELVGERRDTRAPAGPATVFPGFRRMIAAMDGVPAIILGRRMDILAWNDLGARLLITDFDALGADERNYAQLIFTDERVRALYGDWESTGRLCVHQLHMEVAKDPDDPRLRRLVTELSAASVDFRTWWSENQVRDRNRGSKVFRHPDVGDLDLDWETLVSADDPDQRLICWTAEAGSAAAARLEQLRTLA